MWIKFFSTLLSSTFCFPFLTHIPKSSSSSSSPSPAPVACDRAVEERGTEGRTEGGREGSSPRSSLGKLGNGAFSTSLLKREEGTEERGKEGGGVSV